MNGLLFAFITPHSERTQDQIFTHKCWKNSVFVSRSGERKVPIFAASTTQISVNGLCDFSLKPVNI